MENNSVFTAFSHPQPLNQPEIGASGLEQARKNTVAASRMRKVTTMTAAARYFNDAKMVANGYNRAIV